MDKLKQKIEELISNNSSDFKIAKAIKDEIKEYLTTLNEVFKQTQGKDFFVKHTKQIDLFIITLYRYIVRKYFQEFNPSANSLPINLIALGSYGREQLCVYSDIDILVLYKDIKGYNLKSIIEEFITLAWDCGLKLGSRVHKVDEIIEVSKSDITIKTALIESRLIFGSKILWYEYKEQLNIVRKIYKKEFILGKLQEHKDRLLKYPLSMTPNIKDGYGGMRESNLLFWFANVIYGVNSTKELSGVLFSNEDYKLYRSSLEYIFRIRNALHLVVKKKQDKISFDLLPDIAKKLGFQNGRQKAEYVLMQKLFYSLHNVHSFCSYAIKKLIKPYLFDSKNISICKKSRVKKNLFIKDGIVYTSFNANFVRLENLLQELVELPEIKKFDTSYLYFASHTKFPSKQTKRLKTLIKQLFERQNLYPIIKLLYNSNLFIKIIPTAKKIINQPQFDGYHIHPTDIHSIKTLKYISNIDDENVLKVYQSLSKTNKTLLNYCCLFHDIGKGRKTDHHIAGYKLFIKFAKSIELKDEHINLVAKVIRYHNLMSYTSTREDFYSQKVIQNFIGLINTQDCLNLLYCLTYADINSVNPKVYQNLTKTLLKDLYIQATNALKDNSLVKESIRKAKKIEAIKKLKEFSLLNQKLQKKIVQIESTQIFLQLKASEILDIAIKANQVVDKYFEIENGDHLKIKIIRKIPLNLGYLLGRLSFLDIISTKIFQLYDNKKYFEIEYSDNIEDGELDFIIDIVKSSFDMKKEYKFKKPIILKDGIEVDCNYSDELAKFKLVAKDQKGLFAYIAYIFDKFGIDIQSAKIYTSKNKANDLILINKNGNFCPNQEKIIDILMGNNEI